MRPIVFRGDSLARLKGFPENVRRQAGFQLDRLQRGLAPDDFKPMQTVGRGVEELRVRDASGAYRVIYLARLKDGVYVLHAFKKTAQKTSKTDIALAQTPFAGVEPEVMQMKKYRSVWDALEASPEESANMKVRAELVITLQERVKRQAGSQVEKARKLGLSQPRLNDLLRGRLDKFSLDALVNIASRAGLKVDLHVRKAA